VNFETAVGGVGGAATSDAEEVTGASGGTGGKAIYGYFESVTIANATGGNGGAGGGSNTTSPSGGSGGIAVDLVEASEIAIGDITSGQSGAAGTGEFSNLGDGGDGGVAWSVTSELTGACGDAESKPGNTALSVNATGASISVNGTVDATDGGTGVRCQAGAVTVNGNSIASGDGVSLHQTGSGVIKSRGSVIGAVTGTLDMTGEFSTPATGAPQWRIDHTGGTIDMTGMICHNYGNIAVLSPTNLLTLSNSPLIVNADVGANVFDETGAIGVSLYGGSPEYPLEEDVIKDVEYGPGLDKKGTAVAGGGGASNNPYLKIP
jgi:hypothetical protein